MLSVVSATTILPPSTTFIGGTIYDGHTGKITDVVEGASVTVTCNGNIKTYTSESDGSYSVNYDTSVCGVGSTLTVSATHPSYGVGSESGTIHDGNVEFDFALVNVPLVPEFGVAIGGVTLISAICIFFLIRRK